MYAFLWLHVWDLIIFGTVCYGFLYLCDVRTGQKFFCNRHFKCCYFVKERGLDKGLPFFFIVAVLLAPLSYLLAIYAAIRWLCWTPPATNNQQTS